MFVLKWRKWPTLARSQRMMEGCHASFAVSIAFLLRAADREHAVEEQMMLQNPGCFEMNLNKP